MIICLTALGPDLTPGAQLAVAVRLIVSATERMSDGKPYTELVFMDEKPHASHRAVLESPMAIADMAQSAVRGAPAFA